jgi:hypothetical protein
MEEEVLDLPEAFLEENLFLARPCEHASLSLLPREASK